MAPFSGFWFGVKTRRFPGLEVRALRLESKGADFSGEEAGAKASRPRTRRIRVFSESLPIPTDASGAQHPNPQANDKACLCPPPD